MRKSFIGWATKSGIGLSRFSARSRGAHRVDDRRVISGILYMLRSGGRWRDCPAEYGPYTTIYNRFNRWSRQGIWLAMFKAVTDSGLFPLLLSTVPRLRPTAPRPGEKGGLLEHRAFTGWPDDEDPRSDRCAWQASGAAHCARQYARCHDGSRVGVCRRPD